MSGRSSGSVGGEREGIPDRWLWPEERDPWVRFLMVDSWYSGCLCGIVLMGTFACLVAVIFGG